MITSSDSFTTYDLGKYYVILPQVTNWDLEEYKIKFNAKPVAQGFSYTSENNTEWESVESLRKLIKEHVEPSFVL
jgi:UDP-N-acetylglucosamine 4,6-dehydratase/5-epimerase